MAIPPHAGGPNRLGTTVPTQWGGALVAEGASAARRPGETGLNGSTRATHARRGPRTCACSCQRKGRHSCRRPSPRKAWPQRRSCHKESANFFESYKAYSTTRTTGQPAGAHRAMFAYTVKCTISDVGVAEKWVEWYVLGFRGTLHPAARDRAMRDIPRGSWSHLSHTCGHERTCVRVPRQDPGWARAGGHRSRRIFCHLGGAGRLGRRSSGFRGWCSALCSGDARAVAPLTWVGGPNVARGLGGSLCPHLLPPGPLHLQGQGRVRSLPP